MLRLILTLGLNGHHLLWILELWNEWRDLTQSIFFRLMTTVDPQTVLKLALKKSLSQFFILENYPFTPFFQLKSRDRRYIFQLKKPKQIETTLKRHGSRESQNLVLWLIAKSSCGSRKVGFNRHALRSSFIKIWCCCLLNHVTLFDWNDDFF